AKRMRGHIKAARVEVEANGGGGFSAEILLLLDGIFALEQVAAWLPTRSGDGGDERNQLGTQGGEKIRDLGCGRARFIFVEQGVVRDASITDSLCFLPH